MEFTPKKYKIKIVPSERWVEIDENYRISNHGEIMTKVYHHSHNRYSKWKLMKGTNLNGYRQFRINNKPINGHVLVAKYFIGENPDPKKYTVDHIDKVRNNNAAWNLRYATIHTQQRNRKNYRGCVQYYKRYDTFLVRVMIGDERYSRCFKTYDEAFEWKTQFDADHGINDDIPEIPFYIPSL